MTTVAEFSRPLPPGSIIEYAEMLATVVHDWGSKLDVICEGEALIWGWTVDGETCKVVSVPTSPAACGPLGS